MSNKTRRHFEKVQRQLVNRQENKAYYQNGTDWHSPSTDKERSDRRKLTK